MRRKTGKDFEQLVGAIQRSLHSVAIVEDNVRLTDMDTGGSRQIDILIRVKDGPTEFVGIVEVRDHRRRVDCPYIEHVNDKRRAVRADKAFVVSRSGFTAPALTKAQRLGIGTFVYSTATEVDWRPWFMARTLTVVEKIHRLREDVTLYEKGTDHLIDVAADVVQTVKNNAAALVLTDRDGEGILSIGVLFDNALQSLLHEDATVFSSVMGASCPEEAVQLDVLFPGVSEELYVRDEAGILRRIGKVRISSAMYSDTKQVPLQLMHYHDADSSSPISQVATAEFEVHGRPHRVEMILPIAADVLPAESTIVIRLSTHAADEE